MWKNLQRQAGFLIPEGRYLWGGIKIPFAIFKLFLRNQFSIYIFTLQNGEIYNIGDNSPLDMSWIIIDFFWTLYAKIIWIVESMFII